MKIIINISCRRISIKWRIISRYNMYVIMSYLPYIWITLHYTSLNAGTLSLYSSVRLYSYTLPYYDILLWHYKWNASTVLLSGDSTVVNQLTTKYSSPYTTCNIVSVYNVEVLSAFKDINYVLRYDRCMGRAQHMIK